VSVTQQRGIISRQTAASSCSAFVFAGFEQMGNFGLDICHGFRQTCTLNFTAEM